MSVLNDPRVTRNGNDFHVQISHGRYLVQLDDRIRLWWAYDADGLRLGWIGSTDPLDGVLAVRTGYEDVTKLIQALLACDGAEVIA